MNEQTGAGAPTRLLLALLAVVVACGVFPMASTSPAMPVAAQDAGGEEVIVVLDEGEDPVAVAEELGVELTHVYEEVFTGFAGTLPAAAMTEAASARAVRRVFLDGPVQIEAQTIPTGVRRSGVPVESGTNRLAVDSAVNADIAIIDTGVTPRNDLNVAGGVDCVDPKKKKQGKNKKGKKGKGKKDKKDKKKGKNGKGKNGKGNKKGNGKKDKDKKNQKAKERNQQRRERRERRRTKSWEDGNGHGTHTAGIAAALNNDSNVVGVAPGARIWAVKVLDSRGDGTFGDVICGLDWVARRKDTIDIVNMSLSGACPNGACEDTPFHRAIQSVVAAGIPVIVAAGNQTSDASTRTPATYDEVITVSALADTNGEPGGGGVPCFGQTDDTFASFSNDGPDVDIMAPGICILSLSTRGQPVRISGTSQAAPHVVGAAAHFVAQQIEAAGERPTAEETKTWLLNAASRSQDDDGVTGDPDGIEEPVLWLEVLEEP